MQAPRSAKPLVSARELSVRDLFNGKSYHLDFFQRGYVWERPQLEKIIDDLTAKFQPQWDLAHTVDDVENYDPYFMGCIITYQKDGATYLADGQQRVITLLLMLIILNRRTVHREEARGLNAQLRMLVRGGDRSDRRFAVRVGPYETYFGQLLDGRPVSEDGASPDLRRVQSASTHLLARWPEELRQDALLHFARWLLDRVSFVELDAGDAVRGKEMFNAMNDRGRHLGPLDHLKNYLLTDAHEDPEQLDQRWQSMVNSLQADSEAPLNYIRTVIRARYFDIDRSAESDHAKEDSPHEWLHAHANAIWPSKRRGKQAALFTEWLEPLHGRYATLLRAVDQLQGGLEAVWFNSHNDMPRQFDLTLAALQPEDSEGTTWRKARLVANFIDLFVVTRGLRDLPYNRDEVHELVAALLPAVRESRTEDDLSGVLGRAAADWYPHFSHVREARYREGSNRAFVLYFLARLTAWLERGVGGGEQAQRLLTAQADRRRFEVEHLFTKKLGVYPDQATPDEEIQLKRGMLGGLVLINGADNASLGGLRLEDKLLPYQRSNSLAASLHPNAVKGRGTRVFRQFVAQHNLTDKFQPYQPGEPIGPFIESRGRLYQAIAELVWSPEELGLTMPASREPSGHTKNGASIGVYKARTRHTTTLADIAREGMIRPDERLIGRRNGLAHRATWLQDGRIRIESGEIFTTPTPAANRATGNEVGSGWTFWTVERTKATLAAVRSQYLQAVSGTANGP